MQRIDMAEIWKGNENDVGRRAVFLERYHDDQEIAELLSQELDLLAKRTTHYQKISNAQRSLELGHINATQLLIVERICQRLILHTNVDLMIKTMQRQALVEEKKRKRRRHY